MSRSMRKSTLREIKQTFGRFAAILAIIALGVGFFTGIRDTTPAMVNMMDDFLKEKNFYDYRLVSTLGWDDNSVDLLSKKPDVRYAEGSISLDVLFSSAQKSSDEFVLKTHMLTDNMNGLILTEGTLPSAPNECATEKRTGLKIGDKLKVLKNNEKDTIDILGETEYTITAIVESSYYINHERGTTSLGNGTVSGFVYLPKSAFNSDYYNEVFIKFNCDFPIYSDEYDDFIESKNDEWEKIASETANQRYNDVIKDAQKELDEGKAELEEKRTDGQKELDNAEKELLDAKGKLDEAKNKLDLTKKEIEDGQKELDSAKKEIDDDKKQHNDYKKILDDTKATLDESEKQLIDGENQLADSQTVLDSAWDEYYAGISEYEANESTFYAQYGDILEMIDSLPDDRQNLIKSGIEQLEASKQQLDSTKAELDLQQSTLDSSREELQSSRTQFESSKAQYEQGLAEWEKTKSRLETAEKEYNEKNEEFEKGKKEYEDGVDEYESGLVDYNKGHDEYLSKKAEFEKKISDAEKELLDAEDEIKNIKTPDTYVLDRNTNIGYALFENDSEIVEQVARVFPIFFILVAILVCMTTMSRMVEEQRTQIGMLKALGYSQISIMGKYMFYSGSASIIGCILGFALGTKFFPMIIWMTYKLMYVPIDIPYYFDRKLCILAILVSLLCSIGTTFISCRVELGETAACLMRPKAPKAGKRIFLEYIPFIWNKLTFLHKVSIRNIFRYKGRFFMMVIGIGGCTALLLTGFGLKDSIAGFADIQFGEIQIADSSVTFDPENTNKVRSLLEEKSKCFIMLRHSSWDLLYGNKVKSIDLEAVENFEKISPFMTFRDIDGSPLSYPGLNEAVVSHSISERFDVNIGDEITLRDADMRELHLKVSGIFENHAYNLIYITKQTYEAQLDNEIELNKAFVNFAEGSDVPFECTEISKNKNIISTEVFENTKNRMADMMSSLDYIVLLVIICAGALAFIVIYNLTNINITERTREIATIKVLGFFRHETSAYVLRENLVLTSIGIFLGICLGILLHSFVISQIKVDVVDFSIIISPMSYVYSIILTFVFNFIVNLFMTLKLEHINMAESLKSID